MNDLIYRKDAIEALGKMPENPDNSDYVWGQQDEWCLHKYRLERLLPAPQHELIYCRDCLFYSPIVPGSLLALSLPDHEAICRHPNGCLETEPDGFCHYAQRRKREAAK